LATDLIGLRRKPSRSPAVRYCACLQLRADP
jgi:hypothetical protein